MRVTASTVTIHERTPVSAAVRALGPFTESCDYEAAFAIEGPVGRPMSGEQWVHAMFEEAPRAR